MAFRGMDVGAVRHLADQMDAQARAVSSVVSLVDSAVNALGELWRGADLDSFGHLWQASHRPNASAVAADLHSWVTWLRNEAADQERISSTGGALSGVPFAPWVALQDGLVDRLKEGDLFNPWLLVPGAPLF